MTTVGHAISRLTLPQKRRRCAMGWDHRTVGDEYDVALKLFRTLGIRCVELKKEWRVGEEIYEDSHPIRKAAFVYPGTGQHMLIEEYVAVRDYDCDGVTRLGIVIYPPGRRPDLESWTRELEA